LDCERCSSLSSDERQKRANSFSQATARRAVLKADQVRLAANGIESSKQSQLPKGNLHCFADGLATLDDVRDCSALQKRLKRLFRVLHANP
jgi:hypothetical protein